MLMSTLSRGESVSSYRERKLFHTNELAAFLKKHKNTTKGAEYTHTSMGPAPHMIGSYYIPSEHLDTFYDLYKKAAASSQHEHQHEHHHEHHQPLHFVEKHRDIGPIVIDLDFRQSQSTRVYTKQHVKDILYELMKVVDEYIYIPQPPNTQTKLYVLEKGTAPRPTSIAPTPPTYKDGLHIIIPTVVTKPSFQHYLRYTTMKNICNDILHDCHFMNKYEDIYDEAVIERNGWLMYGSNKPDEPDKWRLTQVYNYDNGIIVENTTDINYSVDELVDLFSIRNKYDSNELKLEIPIMHTKDDVRSEVGPSASILSYVATDDKPMSEIKVLLDILNNSRVNDYKTWIEVGMCLKNIDNNLVDVWDEWSKKSPKYINGHCHKVWNGFQKTTNGGLNIGSLYYWAKKDNPELYKTIRHKKIEFFLMKSTNETHNDIARVVYEMFKNDFNFAEMEKGSCWYYYDSHRWKSCPSGSDLRIKISDEVYRQYCKQAAQMNEKASNETIENEQHRFLELAKKFNKIALSLKNSSLKDKIIKECQEFFRVDKKWVENLDEKQHLIGFENGVFDLDSNEFRDGRPDDMLTMSTGYDYTPVIIESVKAKLMAFFDSIMPNETMRDYLLKMQAYQLHGNKYLQQISFWTGSGANGKGLLSSLLIATLGQYCYTPSVTMFTTKKTTSSSANSELAKAKGVRVCIASEPNQDDKLQLGILKAYSGGDKAQARALYKDFIEFTIQFHITIQMNLKPSLNGYDTGFIRRLKMIPFPFKFVETPISPHERVRDNSLEIYFKNDLAIRQQLILILLEYFDKYIKGNKSIEIPKEVEEATKEYLESNNIVGIFIRENLDCTGNKSDKIMATTLFEYFQLKYREAKLTIDMFKQQMEINGHKSLKSNTRDDYRKKVVFEGIAMKETMNQLNDNDQLE
jgi:P4 family phage/plasmid primase-like protien